MIRHFYRFQGDSIFSSLVFASVLILSVFCLASQIYFLLLLEASCLEKITVCVIGTMLLTLPLVQMNKAQREVNRTYKPSRSTNQDKHRERFSNFCYTLNPGEHMPLSIKSYEIFFKKYLLVKTFSSDN